MSSNSSKGPPFFSEFGEKAIRILTKGYSSDQKFTVSSQSEDGVGLVSTLVKKGSLSTGNVAAKYRCKNNTILDVKLDTDSNISTTLTNGILPSTKAIASCKLPDYKSGKLEVRYLHEHATFTMGIGCNKSPVIDVSARVGEHASLTIGIGMMKKSPVIEVSATVGTPCIAFGTEARYATASGKFKKYNAGVSLTKPDFEVAVILAEKGDEVRATYLHHLDWRKRGTVVGEMARKFSTNKNTLTVGCSYAVDNHTIVKAKLNNRGKLEALVQRELKPKSFLTVCGSFNTKAMEKIPKVGISLYLKP